MIRIERRLDQPRWLVVVVPVVSIVVAFVFATVVLAATHHAPLHTFRRLFDAAFLGNGALSETVVAGTPLAFTGLAAAVAFRMKLFNIGGEGQLLTIRHDAFSRKAYVPGVLLALEQLPSLPPGLTLGLDALLD